MVGVYVSLRRTAGRTRLFFWSEVVTNTTITIRGHFVAFIEIKMNLITKFNPEDQFSKNKDYDNGTSFL